MAIKFLAGLDVDGNITLEGGAQLINARMNNQTSDPSGTEGQIYYNSATNKLKLYANGAWVDIATGTDANTTYDLTGVGSTNGSAGVRLTETGTSNHDDVLIVGAGTVGVTRSGNTLTVTGTDSATGTVTSVSGGTGITISGSASVTPTVNIDTAGADNAILVLTAATPVGADTMWFSDADDSTLKKATISSFPGFGKDGTVTSVGSGAGLTGGTITGAGTLDVDYAGSDNIILAAADGVTTPITVASTDKIIVSDATDSNVKFVNISQITTAIGGGTVTSVNGSGGSTGLTLTGGAITTSGTLTLGGTLATGSGGVGLTSYTTGDILYASNSTTLAKLAIGSTGQVLKVASGIPSWATDQNSGGTVTSITVAGDNGNGSSITSSGTISIDGTGLISTSVSGTTVTISTSATSNTGTVTSVATGSGLTGGTITGSGTISVDYGTSGLVADAPTASPQSGDSDDYILIGDDSASGATKKIQLVDIPLNQFGSPNAAISMASNKLTSLSNGTASTDAVNLGQVQSLVAGVGVFQGGYNASTNSPAIAGSSNIALTTGDFFVVTVDGTISFNGSTVAVEVGDMIYANSTITASSNPAESAYAIVIQDANIAGVGASDGATEKGVAGFSSASFAGTANGFITIKAGGISDAQLASTFNKIIGIDTDINTTGVEVVDQISLTDGVVQTLTKRTLPNAAVGSVGVTEIATQAEVDTGTDTFRYVTPATLASHINNDSYTQTFPASTAASTTIAAGTHGLGTGPLVVQCYVAATGVQAQLDVTVNPSNGTVTLATTSNQSANSLRVVMIKVR